MVNDEGFRCLIITIYLSGSDNLTSIMRMCVCLSIIILENRPLPSFHTLIKVINV